MAGHTPGPWTLDESRHEGSINRMDPFRHIGMVSVFQYDHTSRAENLANAHLIAAAPEMLDALKMCEMLFRSLPDWGGYNELAVRDAVVEAIAKAEGRADG